MRAVSGSFRYIFFRSERSTNVSLFQPQGLPSEGELCVPKVPPAGAFRECSKFLE